VHVFISKFEIMSAIFTGIQHHLLLAIKMTFQFATSFLSMHAAKRLGLSSGSYRDGSGLDFSNTAGKGLALVLNHMGVGGRLAEVLGIWHTEMMKVTCLFTKRAG